jgi:hypothetical protein
MYTLISYPTGKIIEALIVSRTRNCMRFVAPGLPDTVELRRSRTDWLTESGERVEFGFLGSPIFEEDDSPAEVALAAGSPVF